MGASWIAAIAMGDGEGGPRGYGGEHFHFGNVPYPPPIQYFFHHPKYKLQVPLPLLPSGSRRQRCSGETRSSDDEAEGVGVSLIAAIAMGDGEDDGITPP